MKLNRIITLAVCLAMFLCMFAVTSLAAEQVEFTSGPIKYTVLEDGTAKIVQYNGTAKSYTIPSEINGKKVTVIGHLAFLHIENLENLTIPGSVRELEMQAVHSCPDLKTVTIKEGLLSSLWQNFEYCPSLKTINIPKNIETLSVFMCCNALEEINVAETNPYICDIDGIVFSKDKKTLVRYPDGKKAEKYIVPSSVKKIANNAFYNAYLVDSIYVPKTVATVEEHAFVYLRFPVFTDAASLPSAWKSALAVRDVCYNYTLSAFKSADLNKLKEDFKKQKLPKITSTSQTTNAIKLNFEWEEFGDDSSYEIFQYISGEWKRIVSVLTSSYTIKNLKPGTTYKFKIRASECFGSDYTDFSDVLSVSTTPGKPATVKSDSQTTAAIKLSWSAVKDATGYTVYRYSPSKKAYVKAGSTTGKTYTVKNLYSATEYTFRVVAYFKASDGKVYNSDSYASIKAATKPGKPSTVKASSQTASSVKLSWSGVTRTTGYTVYRYSPSKKAYVKAGSTTGKSYTVKNLYAATEYTFRVVAYFKASDGKVYNSDSYASIKTATKPSKATVTLKADAPGQLTLEWKAVSGANTYNVYYKVNGGSYKLYKTYASAQKITFKNLKGGDNYTIAVKAGIKVTGGTVWGDVSAKSAKVIYRTPRYLNTMKSGTYYLRYEIGGVEFAEAMKGSLLYATGYDDYGDQYRMVYNGSNKKWYYIYDQYKLYTIIKDSDLPAESRGSEAIKSVKNQEIPTSFKSTKEQIYGETLFCESAMVNGLNTKYCYSGTRLAFIIVDLGNGIQVTQFIDEFTNKVPNSLFPIPSDYKYVA